MKEHIFNLSIERMKQSEFDEAFNKFKSLGWECNGTWDLAKTHTFIQFVWNKSDSPIYPQGFEPRTEAVRIDLNKFPRSR